MIVAGNEYLGFGISIEGLDQPISPDELLDDMLRMGTFGVGSQVDADAARFTEAALEGSKSDMATDIFHLIFLHGASGKDSSRIWLISRGCFQLSGAGELAVI